MRLVPEPPGHIAADSLAFDGRELLLGLSEAEMREERGASMAMIFQDPMRSLNPVLTIGRQIHRSAAPPPEARRTGREAPRDRADGDGGVRLGREIRLGAYPHQFSGGMRQRVMIAIALSCNPRLLIADEATTALDVTIQAQILDLLRALVSDHGTALMLITHDLGVVAGMCERVNVMYAGTFVEETGTADQVFAQPRHPYTLGLLQSVPRLDVGRGSSRCSRFPGQPRNMLDRPTACPFAPRCRFRVEVCTQELQALTSHGHDHKAACFNPVAADEWKRVRAGGHAA